MKNWRNLQVQAIPVMAGGGRSHLLSLNPKLRRNSKGTLFSVRHQGTTDHGVETIHFEDPILTTRWPWRVGQRIFDHRICTSSGHLWPESAFGCYGKLPQRPLSQAEETLCLMGRQTNTRKSCCSMGFKQEIMGIQSAKIKETRELIAAVGQCSWQNSLSKFMIIRCQRLPQVWRDLATHWGWRVKLQLSSNFNYGLCASPKWSIAMSIHNTVLKIITGGPSKCTWHGQLSKSLVLQ